jgi:ABC-type multidrug transport system fused ATPase/permease subunit
VILDLRREMFAKVLRLPSAFFDEVATAQLVAKFTNDVNNIAAAATSVLVVVVRDTVTIVALVGILLWSNWKLTLIAFVVIPPIALVVRAFSARLRVMSRESQRAVGGVAEVLDESISNQRVVRIFGGQGYESARFERASEAIRRYNMKHAVAAAGTVPVTQLIVACAIAAIIYFAAGQAFAGLDGRGRLHRVHRRDRHAAAAAEAPHRRERARAARPRRLRKCLRPGRPGARGRPRHARDRQGAGRVRFEGRDPHLSQRGLARGRGRFHRHPPG